MPKISGFLYYMNKLNVLKQGGTKVTTRKNGKVVSKKIVKNYGSKRKTL